MIVSFCKKWMGFVVMFCFLTNCWAFAKNQPQEYVILLHGLRRTKASMRQLEKSLKKEGYGVCNLGYPSRSGKIEELAAPAIETALEICRKNNAIKIHFVTHSMGGILLRYYLQNHEIEELGRVVMLAPPNQGSEVVEHLRDWPLFRWWNGPAGMQLGIDSTSVPQQLPPADFSVGIIAGTRSMNWWLSTFIPGANDGKVAVERTKLEGMSAFLALPVTHTFIMNNKEVKKQVLYFLENEKFFE